MKKSKQYYREIASKGGKKTASRGKEYMSKIGKRGAMKTKKVWKLAQKALKNNDISRV